MKTQLSRSPRNFGDYLLGAGLALTLLPIVAPFAYMAAAQFAPVERCEIRSDLIIGGGKPARYADVRMCFAWGVVVSSDILEDGER